MRPEEVKEYNRFFCSEENYCACDNCPDNKGMDDWQGRYPCGQWKCWVECHCKEDTESTF